MLGTSSKTTPHSPWLISVGHGLSSEELFVGGFSSNNSSNDKIAIIIR